MGSSHAVTNSVITVQIKCSDTNFAFTFTASFTERIINLKPEHMKYSLKSCAAAELLATERNTLDSSHKTQHIAY
jgi:hypothetical protein